MEAVGDTVQSTVESYEDLTFSAEESGEKNAIQIQVLSVEMGLTVMAESQSGISIGVKWKFNEHGHVWLEFCLIIHCEAL